MAQAIRDNRTKLTLYDTGSGFFDFMMSQILGDKQLVHKVGTHKYLSKPVISKHANQRACSEVV